MQIGCARRSAAFTKAQAADHVVAPLVMTERCAKDNRIHQYQRLIYRQAACAWVSGTA